MDVYLSQQSRSYLSMLIEYQKTLKQRNSLLKKIRADYKSADIGHLDIWDDKYLELSLDLMRARRGYIESLAPRVSELSRHLSSNLESAKIKYSPRLMIPDGASRPQALEVLRSHRQADIKTGVTHFGPHRDLIDIFVNHQPLRPYGSMGQKKTAMIAMKLAALEKLSESRNESAILILDEAFAQLDNNRSQALLSLLSGYGQVFLASAAEPPVDGKAAKFEISNGAIKGRS